MSTTICPLSLHAALPISPVRLHGQHLPVAVRPLPHPPAARDAPRPALGVVVRRRQRRHRRGGGRGDAPALAGPARPARDRKSTRLNSSHLVISYAVFCLK